MKEYFLSVMAAGIAFSIIDSLMPNDGFARYVRLITGVMLMGIMLEPLLLLLVRS